MRNPWMSWWFREANRAAGTGRRIIAAEARRHQEEVAKVWTTQALEMWITLWFPLLPRGRRR